MADKTALKKLLDSRELLPEEVDLWMALGFYVSSREVSLPGYSPKGSFFGPDGKEWHIPVEVARPLRKAMLSLRSQLLTKVYVPVDEYLEVDREG